MVIDPVYDPKATTIPVVRYLVAVATHLHFARAASACRVSQPTLSAMIAKWEKRMRIRVFERNQHGVRLTPAGERIIVAARAALAALEGVERAAGEAKPPFFGPVRLGVIPPVAPYALPFLMPAVERAHPDLEVPIREGTTAELLSSLESGHIDVAVLALDAGLESRYAFERLYRESFLVALPRAHPLAARSALNADDLRQERLLLLAEGHCLREQALAVCGRLADSTLGADYRATSLETLRQLVASGAGITVLPALACLASDERRLVTRPFTGMSAERVIGMLWRSADVRGPAYRLLAGVIRRRLPDGVVRADRLIHPV